ncbi:hypothetical protein [Arenibaculum pallidiluteum]|uniref:hypothetical protein n=1 Tax=Arenibaculum pallidiluteum TaxID=2812559 RepID=UPI001A95E464|nr:hypothetical protein [Arenibaculum pallidiluteum]
MTKTLGILVLVGGLAVSGCTMNHAERRATTGGLLGAGAGAAGGYMLGYDPVMAGVLGGAGGALLGAVTTPEKREVNNYYYGRRGHHGHHHGGHHGGKHRWRGRD